MLMLIAYPTLWAMRCVSSCVVRLLLRRRRAHEVVDLMSIESFERKRESEFVCMHAKHGTHTDLAYE